MDVRGGDPPDPGICERCGVSPTSQLFRGLRASEGSDWYCADCHATATMEE